MLFALSVAVGLTPEMLPMIVTSTLAKGAVFLSRKKVIVKRLDAIQNFGAMDILCTDKTGTLTQNRVVLEYHLNVQGQEDVRVLRHAFLNSYFQTGLKNLMDIAIINRMDEEAKKEMKSMAMAAGAKPVLNFNPLGQVQTMTGYMVNKSFGEVMVGSLEFQTIFVVGLILFFMTFLLNVIAKTVVLKFREEY